VRELDVSDPTVEGYSGFSPLLGWLKFVRKDVIPDYGFITPQGSLSHAFTATATASDVFDVAGRKVPYRHLVSVYSEETLAKLILNFHPRGISIALRLELAAVTRT
jgi:hypothetical protein